MSLLEVLFQSYDVINWLICFARMSLYRGRLSSKCSSVSTTGHGAFFLFHMEILGPNILSENYQYTGISNAAYALFLPVYRDCILYLSFPDFDVFWAKNGHPMNCYSNDINM